MNFSNFTKTLEHGTEPSLPISGGEFSGVGSFLSLVFIVGTFENSFVLVVFSRSTCQHVRISNNIYLVALALADLLQTVLGMPLAILSSYAKFWMFGDAGCVYYGFIITFFGISQITILTAISVDRYFCIVKQNSVMSKNNKKALVLTTLCFGHGFVWAAFPVIGWNSFALEGIDISCSVNWTGKSVVDMSYSLSLMLFAWITPLTVIIYCYGSILHLLRKEAAKPLRRSLKTNFRKKQMNREKSVAITVFIMIAAFVVSWMPYSVVSLMVVFGDPKQIPITVTMIPALFAKSSIIWNPIIYVARHKDFRKACLKRLAACGIMKMTELLRSSKFSITSKQTSEYYALNMNQNVNKSLQAQPCKLSQQNFSTTDDGLTSNSAGQNQPFNSKDDIVKNRPKLTSKMRLETTSTDITALSLDLEKEYLNELDRCNFEMHLQEKVVEESKSSGNNTYKTISVSGFEESKTNLEQTPINLQKSEENKFCSQRCMINKTKYSLDVLETGRRSSTVGIKASSEDSCAIKNVHNSKGRKHKAFLKMNVRFVKSDP